MFECPLRFFRLTGFKMIDASVEPGFEGVLRRENGKDSYRLGIDARGAWNGVGKRAQPCRVFLVFQNGFEKRHAAGASLGFRQKIVLGGGEVVPRRHDDVCDSGGGEQPQGLVSIRDGKNVGGGLEPRHVFPVESAECFESGLVGKLG